ncbi:MAG TPA: DUF4349 domain-containing protein [Gaiellaceae bacterium]|nr:DUF4349 domain-containing protein [Gaiellaceae bacterium]
MPRIALILITATLALAAAACSGGDDDAGSSEDAGAVAEATDGGMEAPVSDEAAGDDAVLASGGSGGNVSLPSVGPNVILTAALTVAVPRDEFEGTIARARTIATGLGGFVVGSSASQGDERRLVQGLLVVRVPERSYARTLERFSDLGTVEALEEDGQDVSQELVDLEARARHLDAVERRLLELLDRADSVAEALTVQGQLNEVQLQLEQARGRLRHLEDQVAYATITLEVHEAQVEAAATGGGGWGIVDAWRTAGHGFVTVVGWMLIAAATVAPFLLVGGLALLAARIAGRRVRPFRRSA